MGNSLRRRTSLRGIGLLLRVFLSLLLFAVLGFILWKTWDDRFILDRYTPGQPVKAQIVETGTLDGRTVETIRLEGFGAKEGDAILFRILHPLHPRDLPGPPAPGGCVIMNYGIGQNLRFFERIAPAFAGHNVALVMPEQYGCGLRRDPNRSLFRKFLDQRERAARVVAETRRIIDYLEARSTTIDPAQIDYIGVSYGGITGCALLAQEPRLRNAAFVMAGGDLPGMLGSLAQQYQPNSRLVWPSIAYAAAWWLSPFEPLDHIGQVPTQQLFFIQVEPDELIPLPSRKSLYEAATAPKTEKVYPGPHNHPSPETIVQMMHDALDWMEHPRFSAPAPAATASAVPVAAPAPLGSGAASSPLPPVSLPDKTTPAQ